FLHRQSASLCRVCRPTGGSSRGTPSIFRLPMARGGRERVGCARPSGRLQLLFFEREAVPGRREQEVLNFPLDIDVRREHRKHGTTQRVLHLVADLELRRHFFAAFLQAAMNAARSASGTSEMRDAPYWPSSFTP